LELTAIPLGAFNCAVMAEDASPANPAIPDPATTETIPLGSSLYARCAPASVRYRPFVELSENARFEGAVTALVNDTATCATAQVHIIHSIKMETPIVATIEATGVA
jgi:hypothetical protein